ncbi:superoxide dismutase [Aquibaculum arenosum]|uniref:Superoxide dismutase n=1 Tax=Aquibaculum arenosum TaxID=3032591 RepID=A0ABT5YIG0_9PROT|nr:superoxide dismutase [Fodinicurvata sp. CAU 1616]MDF2094729.1 superoxide dismutase [Fodinicurvata sp. CAU 1616]
MAFELPQLPYAQDALEPHVSAKTLSFHHGKHHQAYVSKTNELIAGTDLEGKSVEDVIAAARQAGNKGLFNQSAQIWNHTFFWNSMAPNAGGQPNGAVADAISQAFGSYDDFAAKFKASAVGNFGSGWTWLVKGAGGLEIVNTDDADTPLVMDGKTPLLTVDVWEHAYYLDYQNRRPDFVQAFLDHLVNWDFVNKNLAGA